MTVNEIRTKYLQFFEKRGHTVIPSASLVPQNDPTTLFTGSGMQPLVPYLLGEPHPKGTRLTNSQKSFRAEDIEEVGDNRHTTFFEMLGNWSLGDYFKKEQLQWFFGFLTEEIGLPRKNLWITCFEGDTKLNLPKDTESAEIWKSLGVPESRIRFYGSEKNWWSRAGVPEKMPVGEPGGPDSEVFYDFGPSTSSGQARHDAKFGKECHPNCDCGRFLEIGNSVFMQYIKMPDRSFALLPHQNVDFGGGLERLAASANGNADVFLIDVFADIISLLSHFSGKEYGDGRYQKSFRVIADHMRAATFMLGDGVKPSNTERGYILRRLIRRASQHAMKLSVGDKDKEDSMLVRAASITIEKYKHAYPEIGSEEAYERIIGEIWKEEVQFARTLEQGMKEFEKIATGGYISGHQASILGTTHGFPFEMTMELAKERGIDVDEDGFKREMKKHQEISRAGVEQKFKGGLADTSEKTTRLHTAHHLLLRALQEVLGKEVKQRGSNITQERLRIDFSYGQKMTQGQLKEVEDIVNEKIREALPVIRSTIPREEAEKLGAEHEFGAKYPDMVSVYSIGPKEATEDTPRFTEACSIEFCGGPHVGNTREIADGFDPSTPLRAKFSILKEEAVASGIRRIKAVLQ